MKELEKTKRISFSAVLFLVVIVIALLTFKRPQFNFVTTAEKTLETLVNQNQVLSFATFKTLDTATYLLVDVRNNFDYSKGHAKGAINIASSQFLEKPFIDQISQTLKENKTVILYGESPDSANNVWMLLYQLGHQNIRVLSVAASYRNDLFSLDQIEVEKASLDYAIDMEKAKKQVIIKAKVKPVPPKKKVITKPKKKKRAPEGGC
jgi:3-mercaptopyruvate sulfurtransferase SseA